MLSTAVMTGNVTFPLVHKRASLHGEVTEDIGIYDYLTVTEKWVDDASDLVFSARNNVSYD